MQPERTALRFLGHTTTWGELDRRVTALADALSRRGVRFGDRVMILMLNRTEFVETFLAANLLGAIAVPVNFRLTPPEIAFLVEDCEARVVVTEPVLAAVATGVRDIAPILETVIVAGAPAEDGILGYEDLLAERAEGDAGPPIADVPNDSPALIMYTSGTTGRPKGAVLTHTNLTGQTMTGLYTNGADINTDVGFIGVPLFHIAGIGNMLGGLTLGIPTVIHPLGAFDPGQLLDVLEAEKVTGIFLVPGAMAGGVRGPAGATARPADAGHVVGRRPGVGHAAAPDGRDVPGHQDPGGLRPDGDVAGHVHAARGRRAAQARLGGQGDPDRCRPGRRRGHERRRGR